MKATLLVLALAVTLVSISLAQEARQNPKQRAEQLMERARDAKAAGRDDEARELAEQAEKIQRELRGRETNRSATPRPGKETAARGQSPEMERLHHMLEAVGHLHAAGLHEPARNIEEMAARLRHDLEERNRREQADARSRETRTPEAQRAPAELEEMRQQMRRMAAEIEQLRAELKKTSR